MRKSLRLQILWGGEQFRLAEGMPPSMFQTPKVLTEAEVIEAEAELKVLQRHALEVVDPEAKS
jgi:hypothetical protein